MHRRTNSVGSDTWLAALTWVSRIPMFLGRNVSQGFAARKELNDTITVGSSCIQHALAPIRFGTMMSADHSDLRPANLTTLPHFSVSSAMNLPKSMGESAKGVTPNWASFDPNLRSARAAAISL